MTISGPAHAYGVRVRGITKIAAAAVATTALATVLAAESAARPAIVGGSEASMSDHPYVVYIADRYGRQYCGGTLTRANEVVTAAHCVANDSPDDITVVAGRSDTRSSDGVEVGVRSVWTPDEYRSVAQGSDIAVLRLARRLPYRPLPLATKADRELYAVGRKATVLGWGHTSESGGESDVLRKARVPLRPDRDCTSAYSRYQPELMVCAGYRDGGVDACQGDSGGPLVAGGRLIGIVSWGEGCARPGKFGVYTEVRAFAERVKSRTQPPAQQSSGSLLGILGG